MTEGLPTNFCFTALCLLCGATTKINYFTVTSSCLAEHMGAEQDDASYPVQFPP